MKDLGEDAASAWPAGRILPLKEDKLSREPGASRTKVSIYMDLPKLRTPSGSSEGASDTIIKY